MRPLILQPDSEPYGACRALLRSIEAMGGEVQPVVVFPYDGAALDEYRTVGCEVVIEPALAVVRRSTSEGSLLQLARGARASGRIIADLARETGADLIHTNSMSVLSGAFAARRARVPHVWQLREAPRERGMKLRVLQVLLRRRATMVLAVSQSAAGFSPAGAVTRVTYDGYAAPTVAAGERAATAIAAEGELLVGMVGRISPSKAPHLAVEAIAMLRAWGVDDVRLALAGTVYAGYEGYAARGIVESARSLGVENYVHVLGWLDDAAPLMRQLDVLVIATATGEGFPGAVLEALAHGVPVVSAATGGVDELVLDDHTGIACTPGDAGAIADAILQLHDDPQLRARLGAAGREHAKQWSVQASADALLAAWREAVAMGPLG